MADGTLDLWSLLASLLAVGISIVALAQTQGNHRKQMRRDEFAPHRAALDKARVELQAVRKDLDRVAEPTVPLAALVQGFDTEYVKVDTILRSVEEACEEVEKSQLFGTGWCSVLQGYTATWAKEFDIVNDPQFGDQERRDAAQRAVHALAATESYIFIKCRDVVKDHAS